MFGRTALNGAILRHQADGASGGTQPPAGTKPDDATGSDKAEVKSFTEEQANAIVQDRLKREREKQEKAQADAKAQADEAAKAEAAKKLAEEGKFKELVDAKQAEIETLKAQVKDAETVSAKLARYEAVLTARRDAEFGALPEEVAELLSGKDIAEQIEWLTKHGAKFAARADEVPAGQKPTGGTPRPTKGKPVATDSVQSARERQRASGLYD